jgi:hypothetical protein
VNPFRGLTAAFLCALLGAPAAAQLKIPAGRCSGAGGPRAAPILTGPAYDLRAHPLPPAVLAEWGRAGYRANASSSGLLSPSGGPVSAAEFERLSAPFDASVDLMTNGSWSALVFAGYRLQDDSCRLLDPEKRTPVTRLEILDLERQIGSSRGGMAVEQLLAALKGGDPARPPSAAVLARMKQLEARGEFLPDSLRRALNTPGLTAGALRGKAEGEYASMLRAWEGSRSWKELAEDALPPVAGYDIPAPRPGRIESWEKVIGDAFSADTRALFAKTEAGRELLGRFKDSRGRSDFPKMTVLKMSQRPGDAGYGGALAVYDDSSRTVILSHWYVVGQILEGAKPEERAALGRTLADSKGLAEYLRTHPAQRAAVADRMDATIFHELTHAWQFRRQTLGVEGARGNAPTGVILSHEHEAFYAMYRYLYQKMMNDPSAALRSPEFDGYLSLIADPEKFRDQITSRYMSSIAGSTDFKTLEEVQRERRRFLGAPISGGPVAWARAELTRAGLARGDAALKQADADQAATERRYMTDYIPRMQSGTSERLPGALAALGRPDLGLRILAVAPPPPGKADARPDLAARTASLLARPGAGISLEERMNDYGVLEAELRREKKSTPAPLRAAYERDALAFSADLADRAARTRDPAARAAYANAARSWLKVLPRKPETAALERRLKELEKPR